MAYTSFTIRSSVSAGGSALRRTNVLQDASNPTGSGDLVYDSGLKADGYIPAIPASYLTSEFSAVVVQRNKITLSWRLGVELILVPPVDPPEFVPVEMLICGSDTGEPITANDGFEVIKLSGDPELYRNTTDDLAGTTRPYIKDGGWAYYSMFIKYEDTTGAAFYEKVTSLSVQIPLDFKSTETLWNRVPAYYRELDSTYAVTSDSYPYEQGPLYRYVELFGWELDRVRTTIYDTMRINDPQVVHSSAIDALAGQVGAEIRKSDLGTAKLRALLNNIGYLRRTKGTLGSIEAYISALSGCGISYGENALLPEMVVFNVHPHRVNLFTDPFFNQGATTTDNVSPYRSWTDLDEAGREYGWGVYSTAVTPLASAPVITTTDDKLTVVFPVSTVGNTATMYVYSRGEFYYNNEIPYYASAYSSHNFGLRFLGSDDTYLELEGSLQTPTFTDSWNNSALIADFPQYTDTTNTGRKIIGNIPSSTPISSVGSLPVYSFNITLSDTTTTTVTLEKPLIEYRNSSGVFFSGSEPLGGFLPDAAGNTGEGIYDYHWGANAASTVDTDFSYYTLDFYRSKKVAEYVVDNYVIPVNMVKDTNYQINWDVLE